MRKFMIIVMTMSGMFVFSNCQAQVVDNIPVSNVNLQKYLGRWYELARYDHSFERGVEYATANYGMRSDGKIEVINGGMKKDKYKRSVGKAKLTGTPGLLRVSFFGPFYSDYRILMLAEDYSYALVGSGSPKYLWILSRTPELPTRTTDKILAEARNRGYDTSKLIWVTQNREYTVDSF